MIEKCELCESSFEELSSCCGAGTYDDYMFCEDCKEHCSGETNQSDDNPNRCIPCYEEWGDNWPDRI